MANVALITDFGTADWFAGEMKGVVLTAAPGVSCIDITHDIPPGDIRAAAFVLRACFRTFPAGTVFCTVVDPGVGGERAPLAVRSDRYFFVGPDNGSLSWALAEERGCAVYRIENTSLIRARVSATFHGRDIFAPLAAHLASKGTMESVGTLFPDYRKLPWPECFWENDHIIGSIIYIDRFGNAITTIEKEAVGLLNSPTASVRIGKGENIIPMAAFYQQVSSGQGLAYIGSTDFLEIAVNGGSAASEYKLRVGDRVEVVP